MQVKGDRWVVAHDSSNFMRDCPALSFGINAAGVNVAEALGMFVTSRQ
jgi:hypothetical protein